MPMSIQEFYKKFVSATENNVLVESLRRLSLHEDARAMFEEEPNNEWIIWQDSEIGASRV